MQSTRVGLRALGWIALALWWLTPPLSAGIVENASRLMTAGDFDGDGVNELAFISSTGQILVHDLNNARRTALLPGTTAQAVTAADLDGDGTPEIAFINNSTKQLQSYHLPSQTLTTHPFPGGYNQFSMLSAGNVDGGLREELMLRANSDVLVTLQPPEVSEPGKGGKEPVRTWSFRAQTRVSKNSSSRPSPPSRRPTSARSLTR
jgi:hypothetical protein